MKQAPQQKPQFKWMVWSTSKSIANEVPSATAIIETIVAAVAYWCAAIYLETYGFLFAGIAIAPLVLLRSDESVLLGVKWFKRWEKNFLEKDWSDPGKLPQNDFDLLRTVTAISYATAGIAGFALTYALVRHFVVGAGGWNAFAAAFAIAWIAISSGMAMASTLTSMAGVSKTAPALMAGTEVSAVAVISAATKVQLTATIGMVAGAWWAGVGVAAGAGIGAVVLAATLVGLTVAMLARAKLAAIAVGVAVATGLMVAAVAIFAAGVAGIAGVIVVAPTVVGFAIGILLVTLGIRFTATVRHLRAGFKALPLNFRRLTLCTSPKQHPELMPGLVERGSRFTYRDMFDTARNRNDLLSRTFYLILLVSWFVPGWLYRFTLKSTAWFWWPLSFLVSEPERAKEPELFYRQVLDSDMQRLRRAATWLFIFFFVGANGLHFLYSGDLTATINQPVPTFMIMFLLFGVNAVPWQWTGILGAVTTLAVRYWIQAASISLRYAEEKSNPELKGKRPACYAD